MKNDDWFHGILSFLYKKPFDGAIHNIKDGTAKLSEFDGKKAEHLEKLSNVITLLEEKNYVKHLKKKGIYLVLTPEGYNYMRQRRRDVVQDRLFWLSIFISIAAVIIAFLTYKNNTEKATLKQELQEQSTLIEHLQSKLSQKEYDSIPHPLDKDMTK